MGLIILAMVFFGWGISFTIYYLTDYQDILASKKARQLKSKPSPILDQPKIIIPKLQLRPIEEDLKIKEKI